MSFRFIIVCFMLDLLAASVPFGAVASPESGRDREAQPPPIIVLSIIPAQGEPSTSVTLSGSGFTDKTNAYLGNTEVPTQVLGPKLLTFDIPNLPPGLYALYLRRGDGTASRTYNFVLLPPKPEIYTISPDNMYACSSDKNSTVIINGKSFMDKSQVIFDGAAIRGNYISAETFSFTVPHVAAGLHQVQIRNPGGTISGAQGLMIDGRPEIDSVVPGEEYVNYYNLVISGRNFQQDSTLMVTEEKELDQSGNQQPVFDVKRLRSGSANATQREKVIFNNCGRIIYQRFPYSTTLKNFKVQVVNPGGEESSEIQVSAP
jgi:hypothetical protein